MKEDHWVPSAIPILASRQGNSPQGGSWRNFTAHLIWILSLRNQTLGFSMSISHILLCHICLHISVVSGRSVNLLPFALSWPEAESKYHSILITVPFCYVVDIRGSCSSLFHCSFGNITPIHTHLFFKSSLESVYLYIKTILFHLLVSIKGIG